MIGPRVKRFMALLAASLCAWILLAPAQPAFAADVLVTSDPYRHQELTTPPDGVVLAFSRSVDAAAAQIVVANSKGESVNVNTLIVEGTNVTAQVRPNLPKGTYTVHYRVDRPDGDIEGGAFQFAYGRGEWTSLPDERWSGHKEQPSVLVSPSVAPTDSVSPSASPTVIATPTTQPSGSSPTPTVGPAQGSGSNPWPWVAGAGVVIVLGGAGAVVATRRRRGRRVAPPGA